MGALFGFSNLADKAEMFCDSEAAGLGLLNVRTPQISEVWRSNAWGTGTINVHVDLMSSQSIGLIALAAPRDGLLPSSGAFVRVLASTASAGAADALDTRHIAPNNLIPFSDDLANAAWIKRNTTVIANAGADQNGAYTADLFLETGASIRHSVGFDSSINAVSGQTYCWSAYVRAGPNNIGAAARYLVVYVTDGGYQGANRFGCRFDLALGTATNGMAWGTGQFVERGIQSIGGGIYRVWVAGVIAADITLGAWLGFATTWVNDIPGDVYTGNDISGFYVHNAQFSVGSTPPAYIATGASPVSSMQYLSAQMARFGLWAYRPAAPITARYLKLEFTGGGDDYLQVGRLWVGPTLVTTRNAGYGYTQTVIDPGLSARAPLTGVRDVQLGRPYRRLSWSHAYLTSAEADALENALVSVGATGQVFAARDADDLPNTGALGVFNPPPVIARNTFPTRQTEIVIEEDV